MPFDYVTFLSDWVPLDRQSVAMVGKKATLEIENNGGDFLILEYAYPGREEERGVSVTLRVFDTVVGQFRGFYSSPFYIGFKIPSSSQKNLVITIETDASFFRRDEKGEQKEYGLVLFHLELVNRKSDPARYRTLEVKAENLRDHFLKLLSPSREAQPLPIALLIEPTSRCNMNCIMCARSMPGHRREEECDLPEPFIPILGRSMRGIQASRVQGLGEPLMSSSFVPLMNHLEASQVHIVTFNTNGYLLDEKMAQFLVDKGRTFEHFRVSFSLDAATQKIYDRIRGKDLNRTLGNIRSLQDYKRKTGAFNPVLFMNMTLSRTNVQDLPKFIKLAHEIGAQVELSSLALDKNYEAIRIQKSPRFLFDYRKEVLAAYPELLDKYLKKAERLGKRLGVPIYKAGDVTYRDEPPPRFRLLSRFRALLRQAAKGDPCSAAAPDLSRSSHKKDPAFENLPLCLLPWSQMVISSKGDISLCCVQGSIDHLKNYSSIEEAWHSEKICAIREQLSRRIFPPECETADCTVRRWNTRVCIIHQ
jgi:MoaA/NifB/PqqE/SkfB family radical SAM enzyme